MLQDVASGTEFWHSHGVVHPELKPENVFLRMIEGQVAGRAKIEDFCFSQPDDSREEDTTELVPNDRGSYAIHMPPER